MNGQKSSAISRREFARRAAIASAAASVVPAKILVAEKIVATAESQQNPPAPKLSAESQTEAEARFQGIIGQFGDRFSDDQKADLKRLCYLAQPPLDRLRAFALENGDGPALYLKPLIEREKKTATTTPAQAGSPNAPKKH
jgi:acyl transferase domain-containing protein